LFDAGLETDDRLATAEPAALLAALDNGVSAQKVADRVLGLAIVHSPGEEPSLEFWNAFELPWLEVMARAVEAPALNDDQRKDLLVRFGSVISPRNTQGAIAPGPSAANAENVVARILAATAKLPASSQVGVWQNILASPSGGLRSHLLRFAPNDAATRAMV